MCSFLSNINWDAVSALSTFGAVVIACVALYQTHKSINENLRVSLFDKRLELYMKMIEPYFQVFKFADIIREKCVVYLEDGDVHQKDSIHKLLHQQFYTVCSKIDPYYKTYTLSLFGSNVTDILTRIDSLCVELDKKVVDKSIKELLDIKGIKKYLDELIKLRKDLSFELAKFFGVDSKVFYNYFIKDNFDG